MLWKIKYISQKESHSSYQNTGNMESLLKNSTTFKHNKFFSNTKIWSNLINVFHLKVLTLDIGARNRQWP